MKRHTKSPVLNIGIRGDQLEHDRIQLERNLQHPDLSLHLSSHDDDTIEYARHNSAPSAFPDFISFDHRSRDNFDAWSYRTGDDEESGHAPPSSRSRSVRIRSPHSSATSASSDSDSPRPRLADALSPKHPRSPHAPHHPNHQHAQVPPSPLTHAIDDTPRPNRRHAPAVSLPTPASQFTKAARGLRRDLAEEEHGHDRNPFTDIANRVETGDATRGSTHHSKSRVYLPDVAGPSGVESPAKLGGGYNASRPRDSEGACISSHA